jgi:myo-inositol-1(or 4)-monophosphatase
MTNEKLLEIAIAAAMKAGSYLLANYSDTLTTTTKESVRDLSTPVDHAAEAEVFTVLRAADPGTAILSEEHGFQGTDSGDGHWIVDALDGTVNYLHHVPFFSVSIAYVRGGSPVVGAVYAPLVDDIYYGAEGVGAFKNQKRLQTPDRMPTESLFAATFSGRNHEPARRHEEFALFASVNDASRGCLRTGSAALNLAYLAEGRFNGCWGKSNKAWDISAGLLIARLAGASVLTVDSDAKQHLSSYLAAPPRNHAWLEPQVAKVFSTR